jgi:VWFA-related protein
MKHVTRNGMVGALALALAVVCSPLVAQPVAQQSQKQSIPDAPKPQALPNLTPLSPVGPSLPNAPSSPAPADPSLKENDGVAPGGALPSTPAPSSAAQQAEQEDQEQGPQPEMNHRSDIHIYTNLVQIPFTVKDSRGHLMPGLTWRDVRVYENGVRQHMSVFTVDPFPLSVSVVIDQSVPFDTMTKVNNSLESLQGAFSKYDEVAVFTYNHGVTKQTEFTAAQSARLGAVLEYSKGKGNDFAAVDSGPLAHNITKNGYEIDPNTSPNRGRSVNGGFETPERESHTLLDAILEAAQETTHAPKERRRIVYVISDGKEWGSKAKEKDVIKYLQANNVEVYATLVGDSAVPGLGFLDRIHLPGQMRDDILPRLVAATGGETDPEYRQGGIEKSFARITEEVRTQYTVGYYTRLSPLNESFRRVEVRVLRPSLTIISKEGYYPNANDNRPPATPAATTAKAPAPAPAPVAH